MRGKIIVSIPDGSCLYRSMATGLLLLHNGNMCHGAPWGEERTITEIAHNVVARWIRYLVKHSLCYDLTCHIGSKIDGTMSLEIVLHTLGRVILKRGPEYTFPTKREKRYFIRKLLPTISKPPRQQTACYPCGLTPMELSVSGREEESFETYCRRLSYYETWGGEAECYVAAQVIGIPIEVFLKKNKKRKFYYVPDNTSIKIYSLLLLYDPKNNHYDAIARTNKLPALSSFYS